jgi:hypothetical protein
MKEKQLEILRKVSKGDLSPDDAHLQLLGLSIVSNSLPLDGTWSFAMFMKDWHQHSSGEYFYKSKDFHQWPPDETATKEELLKRFFGQ